MGIILFALWMVFNAHFAPDTAFFEILIFGIFFSAIIYLFTVKFTKWTFAWDMFFLRNIHLFIAYSAVLLRDVLIADFKVISLILSPRKKPSPVIISFSLPIKSEMLRSMLSNSITLTPGTITISATDEHFTVHCLESEYMDGFENSTLVRIIMKMEGKLK